MTIAPTTNNYQLSHRSRRVASFMKKTFQDFGASEKVPMELDEVLHNNNNNNNDIDTNNDNKNNVTKSEAARMVLEMLTLSTRGFMTIKQKKAFGTIFIAPTKQLLYTESF